MTEAAFKVGSIACRTVINASYCYDYAAMTVAGYGLAVILGAFAFLCIALQRGTR